MPVEFKDYYATLGVAREATPEEIKRAFRKLARKHHPDVAKDKSQAEARFKEINEAYEVLGDQEKRRRYDQLGSNWDEEPHPFARASGRATSGAPEFNFGGTGFSDFFEQYFSGANRHGYGFPTSRASSGPTAARTRRGNDIEGDILVTLEEVMHGSIRTISLQHQDPANGKTQSQQFDVRIPPGVAEGRRIRIAGHGEPGHGGAEAGDLYLRVRHAAHPDFHAEGSDLHYELDLAPWEAVLGAEIRVPTLDGHLTLKVPPASEAGQHLRIRGRGLPKPNNQRGDFHAILNIRIPETLTPAERQLWEHLRDASHFSPRRRS